MSDFEEKLNKLDEENEEMYKFTDKLDMNLRQLHRAYVVASISNKNSIANPVRVFHTLKDRHDWLDRMEKSMNSFLDVMKEQSITYSEQMEYFSQAVGMLKVAILKDAQLLESR